MGALNGSFCGEPNHNPMGFAIEKRTLAEFLDKYQPFFSNAGLLRMKERVG